MNDIVVNGCTVTGIVEGDSNLSGFIPDLIELSRQGTFTSDELITYYDFDDVEKTVEDSESGETTKPVLRVSEP
ncbi:aryl-alcohol dehydrogenase [Halobaculum gomorrense]|uniref:aryl-alcohol dehydrogenase n=1 Tax=Halobaculum gomorrense TaxID=43928 RepID=UPI00093324A4|nr:aryl-alcohol dehydrogenase [Halobaculum gomorrense]